MDLFHPRVPGSGFRSLAWGDGVGLCWPRKPFPAATVSSVVQVPSSGRKWLLGCLFWLRTPRRPLGRGPGKLGADLCGARHPAEGPEPGAGDANPRGCWAPGMLTVEVWGLVNRKEQRGSQGCLCHFCGLYMTVLLVLEVKTWEGAG